MPLLYVGPKGTSHSRYFRRAHTRTLCSFVGEKITKIKTKTTKRFSNGYVCIVLFIIVYIVIKNTMEISAYTPAIIVFIIISPPRLESTRF